MTRPIVWSVVVLAAVAGAATVASGRLAHLASVGVPVHRPTVAPPDVPVRSFEPVVSIDADLQGHFVVGPTVDGQRVVMLVDTGASIVALRAEDAAAIGLRPAAVDYTRRLSTANGTIAAAPVRLREVRLNGILVRDVEAVVMPPGRLGISLLGMSFLRGLKGFDISRGRLTLRG